jgi:hypothetical protein
MTPKTLLAAFGALTAVLAACGTTNNNIVAKCGAGTRLQGDTCVTDLPDVGIPDVGSVVRDAESDGGVADTGVDAGPPDEPCPVADADTAVFNCDPKCGPMTGADICRNASCKGVGEPLQPNTDSNRHWLQIRPFSKLTAAKSILRLPRDPWRVFDTCDPTRSYPPADGFYTVSKKQPKYYIVVALFGLEQAPPTYPTVFTVAAKSFESDYFQADRSYCPPFRPFDPPCPSRDRAYPLADVLLTPGCKTYDIVDCSSSPNCWESTSQRLREMAVVIASNAVTQPATNIVFYRGQTVTCGSLP